MGNLVATNIRLPKDELIQYRQLALREGKSFSKFLRDILVRYSHQVYMKGAAKFDAKELRNKKADDPIWKLKPFSFKKINKSNWAKSQDYYIYDVD